jgi:hypothetical protein
LYTGSENLKTSSFRLEEKQAKEIDNYAKKKKIDRSAAARQIIEIGLKESKKKEALEKIRTKEWTVWKGAEYCEESYRSFLGLLRGNNIPFPLSEAELKRELDENRSK